MANHRTYDSFGNLVHETNAAVDLLFGYTGRLWDEATGLQNNLHRIYDPVTGRFMTVDPIGFLAGDTNLYRYVGNEASTQTDPSGLITIGRIGLRLAPRIGARGPKPIPTPKPQLGPTTDIAPPIPLPQGANRPPNEPPQEQTNREEPFDPCKGRLRYVASPKHGPKGLGKISPAPTDGARTIEHSIPVKDTSRVRVGIDPVTGEFVVFRETHPGTCIYHGYRVRWDDLQQEMQNALKKAGKVTSKGKVIQPPGSTGENTPGLLDKLQDIWEKINNPPPNPEDDIA